MLGRKHIFSMFFLCLAVQACLLSSRSQRSHAYRAEQYSRAGQYSDAIREYELHMQSRLDSENRPQEENPYFYYLLIGDLYLQAMNYTGARASYEAALEKNVQQELVSERFRLLAKWLRDKDRYQEALELLSAYRHLDPPLFDIELDRTHKQWVRSEQEKDEN